MKKPDFDVDTFVTVFVAISVAIIAFVGIILYG